MEKISDNWLFTPSWDEGFKKAEKVRLPHTVSETPLHYADSNDYQMVSGYRRTLVLNEEDKTKRLFLLFEGAAHIATIYFNGKELFQHRCGYTSFRVEITEYAKVGENEILVKLDSRENGSIPPFGFVIDYLTYGGLYRDVFLDRRSSTYISDLFIKTPTLTSLEVDYTLDGKEKGSILSEILDSKGNVLFSSSSDSLTFKKDGLKVSPWSPSSPTLYTLRSTLIIDGNAVDQREDTFGFRTVSFKGKDFILNGEKFFFYGLNRHQSWPYIGYAAPERMQREDARTLKYELGCNTVRTSHYPQSRYFVDECDRIGLLVFTEIPGWQHIGDEDWKKTAIQNTEEMILQYRNHPSIFLWGVRINESLDDDDFYRRTNEVAHTLDPTRPTSGVRYLEKSSLLEDAYAFNDFSHKGDNKGVKDRKHVLKQKDKPLFVSESNGHMFPTKAYDNWARRQEHALRHARVLNDAMADGGHTGCLEWCMADYATHKDFGSGDRVCYHGVLDSFRNPKDAAYMWRSQGESEEVIHVSSSMDIGDYDGGLRGKVWIFTNASSVKVKKNGKEISTISSSPFKSLPHGPMAFSDIIGNQLETEEGYSKAKAERVKECLNAAAEKGFQNLGIKYLLKLLWCSLRYGLTFSDGVELYGKYVSLWGGESTKWEFVGVWNGKEGKKVTLLPSSSLSLAIYRDTDTLYEGDSYDETLIRLRAIDDNGNVAPYAMIPVTVEAEGPVTTVGPKVVVLEGGMGGVIIKTDGRCGKGKVHFTFNGKESEVEFIVKEKK